MKAVNSGAVLKLFEHAAEGPEHVLGGFAISAIRSGEEYSLALVPFGETSPEAMRILAEHGIDMIDEQEGK